MPNHTPIAYQSDSYANSMVDAIEVALHPDIVNHWRQLRDFEMRRHLAEILANRVLAEEAFPNPNIRDNILALIDSSLEGLHGKDVVEKYIRSNSR